MALSDCVTKIDSQGKELLEHGSALFPVACYHDDLQQMDVPWHWHEELEVFIVSEGTAVVTSGKEKFVVHQGEGFFVNSGVLHAAWRKDESPCRFHSIVFHPRLVGGSVDSIFWQNYVHPLMDNSSLEYMLLDKSQTWHTKILEFIEDAWQLCKVESHGYEFLVRDHLSQLILHLSDAHPVTQKHVSEKSIRDHERVKIMLQYVQNHYGEALTISNLAAQASVSESECLRCFRNVIGRSPVQYIKQFRIQKAAELLAATAMKVGDIGALCGFQDSSYFVKTFREYKRVTPAEYRKQHQT